MSKDTFLDWSTTASDNTDIGGLNINEGCPAANMNNMGRTIMAQARSGIQPKLKYSAKSGNYTALGSDHGVFFRFTAAATLTLTAAATLGADWSCAVVADGGDVTIDPDSSETIDGKTTLTVRDGSAVIVICTGTAFRTDLGADPVSSKGHLYGLTLSNSSGDATNDIDVAAGEASSDETVPHLMRLTSALTKRLDAAWSVGSNQGGLDTGSIANTTYHVWLIQRSDTGVVDALFSASASSPTMPTNYDRKRRIGSIIRSAGAILAFFQEGDVFTFEQPILDVNANNPGTSAVTATISTPTGIRVQAFGTTNLTSTSTTFVSVAYISSLAVAAIAPNYNTSNTVTIQTLSTAGTYRAVSSWRCFTNMSSQIRYQLNASDANSTIRILLFGWVDTRGR